MIVFLSLLNNIYLPFSGIIFISPFLGQYISPLLWDNMKGRGLTGVEICESGDYPEVQEVKRVVQGQNPLDLSMK
ncbi:hypothetical protein VNO78_22847 [Psophocarpus tetragonolobus]|uniref:Uncharacterized protein n=1 Tax=Psophocarpus tetragonolobus TaxID=3891 RepID=A0AAN9S2A7_PSOTE